MRPLSRGKQRNVPNCSFMQTSLQIATKQQWRVCECDSDQCNSVKALQRTALALLQEKYVFIMVLWAFCVSIIVNKASQRRNDMGSDLYHLYMHLFDTYCSHRSNFQLYNAATGANLCTHMNSTHESLVCFMFMHCFWWKPLKHHEVKCLKVFLSHMSVTYNISHIHQYLSQH